MALVDIFKNKENIDRSHGLKKIIKYLENTKIKIGLKPKSEDKKKELPPLPNIKIKGNNESINNNSVDDEAKLNKKVDKLPAKKNKSFKMDTSFSKDD